MLQVDPDIQKAKRYRYQICLIIFSSYILVFFHRLCPVVIALDMQAYFAVSSTLLGVLGSAYFYPYAIMQLPTGGCLFLDGALAAARKRGNNIS